MRVKLGLMVNMDCMCGSSVGNISPTISAATLFKSTFDFANPLVAQVMSHLSSTEIIMVNLWL